MNYQQQAIAGMNPVELIIALYDGMVRLLYQAVDAVEHTDTPGRRTAIGRVFQILMHLQSRLRMDVGGSSAKALSEFYASIFALCLEGSRLESADRLREAIRCIRDVREAWKVAARDPEVLLLLGAQPQTPQLTSPAPLPAADSAASSWTA